MKRIMHFEEESRLVPDGSEAILPEDAAAAGAAAARVLCPKGGRLLAAHSGEKGAAALAFAFASGAAASGADCILAGECPATAASYTLRQLGCTGGCYVHTEVTASLRMMAADGLGLFADCEDRIADRVRRCADIPYAHYGRISRFDGAEELYASAVRGMMSSDGGRIYADINSSSESVMRCCERILEGRNPRTGTRIAFHISGDGGRISAYSDETGYVFRDKLIMICCMDLFEQGIDAAMCGRPSAALEKMAESYGRNIISCGRSVCLDGKKPSVGCAEARKLASSQLFMHDGIALMARVTDLLRRNDMTLKEAVDKLPPYASVTRFIPADKPSELLRRLCTVSADGTADGVVADGAGGRVVIRPVRTGKGVMLSVESYALEAAAELCDFYGEIIASGRSLSE